MKKLIFASLSAIVLAGSVAPYAGALNGADTVRSLSTSSVQVAVKADDVLASGSFVTVDQGHPTTGQAKIVTENGQRYLELDSNFGTASGPAVQVVLYSGDTAPVNLGNSGYVVLGNLQRFDGAQRYTISDDIDLDDYGSVAIWCAQFDVTFGYADI